MDSEIRIEAQHAGSIPSGRVPATIMRIPVCIVFVLLLLAPGTPVSRSSSESNGAWLQQRPASSEPPEFAEATQLSQRVAELYRQGKYDQALPLARRVVEIAQSTFGAADVHVAVALQNLTEIYLAKKNVKEAEKLLEQVVAILAGSAERESDSAVVAWRRLASLRYDRGDYEKAETAFQRALEIMERKVGKENAELADILWDLANAHSAAHHYVEAEHQALRALRIQEKRFGPSHADTIAMMKKYACGVASIDRANLKVKDDDAEFTGEEREINARAICWTGQLKDDCTGKSRQPLSSRMLARGSVINSLATHLQVPAGYPGPGTWGMGKGTAYLAVLVDEAGKVINARAVCGETSSRFIGLSLAAARASTFPATELNGQPVQIAGFMTYSFAIR